ncbi:hypothetical protein FQR65_LT17083 [Abscondita terminalis]|nr:hypothetical protein FQR65_LT17083 [Abscondita terminalis]
MKDQTWDNLCAAFNSKSSTADRTVSQLRTKELYKTGGGAAVITPLTDYEEKLMHILSSSVRGLSSCNDSDTVCTTVTPSTILAELSNDNVIEIFVILNTPRPLEVTEICSPHETIDNDKENVLIATGIGLLLSTRKYTLVFITTT